MAQGDHERARAYFEEGLALSRELGYWIEWAVWKLAKVAQAQGEHEEARAFFAAARGGFEETVAANRETGDNEKIAPKLTDDSR